MRPARRTTALVVAIALLSSATPGTWAQAPAQSYAKGMKLRAHLDATPRARRTTRQYEETLNAFRAVYHADRADSHADDSVEAVAELLAEEGRLFNDLALLRSAIEQLAFLRRDFAASPFSIPALLTTGEIQARDLHQSAQARATFSEFLENYPRSSLAPQARAELRRLGGVPPPFVMSHTVAGGRVYAPAPGAQAATRERDTSSAVTAKPAASSGAPDSASGGSQGGQETPAAKRPESPSAQRVPVSNFGAGAGNPASPDRVPAAAAASPQPATRVVGGVPVYRPAGTAGSRAKMSLVTGIRHWSTANYTRVAVDLQDEVPFEASRVSGPDRIFFDLHGAKLAPDLAGKAVTVTDGGFLERVRAAQFSGDVVRVVLDVSDVSDYSAFWLPDPSRLIIDIHGRPKGAPPPVFANAAPASTSARPAGNTTQASSSAAATAQAGVPSEDSSREQSAQLTPDELAARLKAAAGAPIPATAEHTPAARAAANGAPAPRSARAAAPGTFIADTAAPGSPATPPSRSGDTVAAIAALSQQPSRVRATRVPTTAPVASVSTPSAASLASTAPVVETAGNSAAPAALTPEPSNTTDGSSRRKGKGAKKPELAVVPPETPGVAARPADPDATGGRSMVRALGLKINRIVVDAGHGGHDSGTLGPGGIEEKDVVLDVALRLGKLLKQRLGADVIYTRDDDTFIPLETRTAIANKAQADLFISVHANSSPDSSARGVETYYLNFTTSADALEVAARENAVSDESIHQLSDLVKKITLQDKIAESREFAADVENSLYQGLESGNSGLKDRGVKKAPFVVLIGANMPSILAEISFLTNPSDASQLRDGNYRQRIAESLYKGVARYERSLSGAHLDESAATR